jgi:transcriptional regulator with GAF, ATPase, and Fis domain
VDVRVLAATHHDLEADVAAGRFRRDLYHRLDVFRIAVPPLRERRDDIPLLVEHFLSRPDGPAVGIDPAALGMLLNYDFPGNVRELQHLIERARFLAKGPRIVPADFPDPLRRSGGGGHGGAPGAERLYQRIVRDGESFWEVVQGPFLRREVSRDEVRKLVARVHREAGGSYKELARVLGLDQDYKKLLNFLRNHHLGVDAED